MRYFLSWVLVMFSSIGVIAVIRHPEKEMLLTCAIAFIVYSIIEKVKR